MGLSRWGAGNIEVPGAQDTYSLSVGGSGTSVSLSGVTNDCSCLWSLRSASGSFEYGFAQQGMSDVGPTFLAAGSYVLTVTGQVATTGTYGFSLLAVPPPDTFAIAFGATISDGTPASGAGNIELPGAQDVYTFLASPVGGNHIDLSSTTCTGASFVLSAPSGRQLARGGLCNANEIVDIPEAGTYQLLVVYAGSGTGTYSFHLASTSAAVTVTVPTADVVPLVLGNAVSNGLPQAGAGNIENAGAVDDYPFTGIAGQTMRFNDTGQHPCCDMLWSLYAPDGTGLATHALNQYPGQQFTLTQSGTYEIEVAGSGSATGTYGFSLTSVPDAQTFPINIGDTVTNGTPMTGAGNIETGGSVDDYTFTGAAGQTVRFNDSGLVVCCTLYWQLFAPDGSALGGDWFNFTTGARLHLAGERAVHDPGERIRQRVRHDRYLRFLVDLGARAAGLRHRAGRLRIERCARGGCGQHRDPRRRRRVHVRRYRGRVGALRRSRGHSVLQPVLAVGRARRFGGRSRLVRPHERSRVHVAGVG